MKVILLGRRRVSCNTINILILYWLWFFSNHSQATHASIVSRRLDKEIRQILIDDFFVLII